MAEADITIVGLGPGDVARRTAEAQAAIDGATRLYVRSHPGVDLGDLLARSGVIDVSTLRDQSATLAARWDAPAAAICEAARDEPVVLAIPGHPRFGEGLVKQTLAFAKRAGLSTRLVDGVSVLDLVANALGIDPLLDGVQLFNGRTVALIDAEAPFAGGLFTGTPRRPMLFTHVYDAAGTAALHRILEPLYPASHPVTRIEAAGMPGQRLDDLTVGQLADMPAGPLVALWVPALADLDATADPRTMQHIVARLRRPDGCPWDRKQTNATLAKNLVDEVYEVVDAIERGTMDDLAEELGDLSLLILMQAQIAHEAGHFSIEDVYRGIATKIIGRHPHVFGEAMAGDADDVVGIWQQVKAKEKAGKPDAVGKDADGEPHSMPALTRASRVLGKHPVVADDTTPGLLREVAAIVARGDDPEAVLRAQLRAHVSRKSPG